MEMRLADVSSNSTIEDLMNSQPPHQLNCSIGDVEIVEDSRFAKCMDEFDPEAFLSIDSI